MQFEDLHSFLVDSIFTFFSFVCWYNVLYENHSFFFRPTLFVWCGVATST